MVKRSLDDGKPSRSIVRGRLSSPHPARPWPHVPHQGTVSSRQSRRGWSTDCASCSGICGGRTPSLAVVAQVVVLDKSPSQLELEDRPLFALASQTVPGVYSGSADQHGVMTAGEAIRKSRAQKRPTLVDSTHWDWDPTQMGTASLVQVKVPDHSSSPITVASKQLCEILVRLVVFGCESCLTRRRTPGNAVDEGIDHYRPTRRCLSCPVARAEAWRGHVHTS